MEYVSYSLILISSVSEVIRAEAETCFPKYANKYSNVIFVLDDKQKFSAHKG